jgi:hypothetical protein
MSRFFLAFLAMLAGTCAYAQESEAPRVGVLRVNAPTFFLVRPLANSRSFGTIRIGTKLLWVEGQSDSGYLRAIGEFGAIGWVAASDVAVVQSPPSLGATEAAKTACSTSLSACPTSGCARPNSPEGVAYSFSYRSSSLGLRCPL